MRPSPRLSAGDPATPAQLKRLNELRLLQKALAGGDHVTCDVAWAVLAEALEAGLWHATPRERQPEWAPTSSATPRGEG